MKLFLKFYISEVMDVMEQLRGLREDRDLSQKDVADMLNVSLSTYSDYEHENLNIPIASLRKLSEYFNTSVDYILGLTDDSKPYPKRKNRG